jgi:hypothetical protein
MADILSDGMIDPPTHITLALEVRTSNNDTLHAPTNVRTGHITKSVTESASFTVKRMSSVADAKFESALAVIRDALADYPDDLARINVPRAATVLESIHFDAPSSGHKAFALADANARPKFDALKAHIAAWNALYSEGEQIEKRLDTTFKLVSLSILMSYKETFGANCDAPNVNAAAKQFELFWDAKGILDTYATNKSKCVAVYHSYSMTPCYAATSYQHAIAVAARRALETVPGYVAATDRLAILVALTRKYHEDVDVLITELFRATVVHRDAIAFQTCVSDTYNGWRPEDLKNRPKATEKPRKFDELFNMSSGGELGGVIARETEHRGANSLDLSAYI